MIQRPQVVILRVQLNSARQHIIRNRAEEGLCGVQMRGPFDVLKRVFASRACAREYVAFEPRAYGANLRGDCVSSCSDNGCLRYVLIQYLSDYML